MAAITMRNIVKKYGDGYPAVNDVSLDIADGEFMILVGPSGCGKSTLLRTLSRLLAPNAGEVVLDARHLEYGVVSSEETLIDSIAELLQRERAAVARGRR